MISFDTILIFIVLAFAAYGFFTGLVQGIGAIVGLYLGALLATAYYKPIGDFLTPIFGGNAVVAALVAFSLLFLLITKLVGIGFYLVSRLFQVISIIPGLRMIDRLGGLGLGVLEGILIVGTILHFYLQLRTTLPAAPPLPHSILAGMLTSIATALLPMLDQVRSAVERAVTLVPHG